MNVFSIHISSEIIYFLMERMLFLPLDGGNPISSNFFSFRKKYRKYFSIITFEIEKKGKNKKERYV